jgi:hypothetical protein
MVTKLMFKYAMTMFIARRQLHRDLDIKKVKNGSLLKVCERHLAFMHFKRRKNWKDFWIQGA